MPPEGEACFVQEPGQVGARAARQVSHSTHQELRLGQGENCLRPSATTPPPQGSVEPGLCRLPGGGWTKPPGA